MAFQAAERRQLRDAFAAALKKVIADGTYDELIKKWKLDLSHLQGRLHRRRTDALRRHDGAQADLSITRRGGRRAAAPSPPASLRPDDGRGRSFIVLGALLIAPSPSARSTGRRRANICSGRRILWGLVNTIWMSIACMAGRHRHRRPLRGRPRLAQPGAALRRHRLCLVLSRHAGHPPAPDLVQPGAGLSPSRHSRPLDFRTVDIITPASRRFSVSD